MVARASGQTGLVPVHIGVSDPEAGRLTDGWQHTREAAHQAQLRDALAAVSWAKAGVTPRWRGQEASDCAAAIEPSVVAGMGADELERFLTGTKRRKEVALLLVSIGDEADDAEEGVQSVFARGASVHVAKDYACVLGAPLPRGAQISLAPGVTGADKDLGLRLLNGRNEDAPWWALTPQELFIQGGSTGAEPLPLGGRLEPILVDGVGDTVAGVWVHDDGGQRWYVLPAPVD